MMRPVCAKSLQSRAFHCLDEGDSEIVHFFDYKSTKNTSTFMIFVVGRSKQ